MTETTRQLKGIHPECAGRVRESNKSENIGNQSRTFGFTDIAMKMECFTYLSTNGVQLR